MNQHQPVLSQVPPAIPFPNGRPGHNVPFTPPQYPHHPQQYQSYPYQYPMHYQRPPPQWQPYPMQMSMGRGYQQYPPMNSYPSQQHYPRMRPSPRQHPSSSPIHSAQGMLSPSSSSSTSFQAPSAVSMQPNNSRLAPPTPPPQPRAPTPPITRTPFYPPLPWQSFEGRFSPRKPRRRKRPVPQSNSAPVELPSPQSPFAEATEFTQKSGAPDESSAPVEEPSIGPSSLETPPTSHPPSEIPSTQPTTPSSIAAPQQSTPKASTSARPIAPSTSIIPAIPNLPLQSRAPKRTTTSVASDATKSASPSNVHQSARAAGVAAGDDAEESTTFKESAPPPTKAAPKSWAELLRTKASPASPMPAPSVNSSTPQINGVFPVRANTLAETLSSYSVKDNGAEKVAFIKPRGIVNTGNMCYMNSVSERLGLSHEGTT